MSSNMNAQNCPTYRVILRIFQYNYSHLIHSLRSLSYDWPTVSPKASCLHSTSSFNFQYYRVSLSLFSSCLRLLHGLAVNPMLNCTFLSMTSFRRQFLSKIWPIQLASLPFIICKIFLSALTLSSNTTWFFTWSVQLILSILLQHHIQKHPCAVTATLSFCHNYILKGRKGRTARSLPPKTRRRRGKKTILFTNCHQK